MPWKLSMAFAKQVLLQNTISYLLVVNQALLDDDPDQSDVLFQPHQLCAHGTIVDETAIRHRGADGRSGKQLIRVYDTTVPLYFDGWKTFLSIVKPANEDICCLQCLELISSLGYEPQEHIATCRANSVVHQSTLLYWHTRLGFPTLEVTKWTL